MDPKRWEQIDKLLEETLEQEHAQRTAFLAQACGGDAELRKAVEELLAAHEEAGSFGETPALDLAAGAMAELPVRSLVGKRRGPHELLCLSGEAGWERSAGHGTRGLIASAL